MPVVNRAVPARRLAASPPKSGSVWDRVKPIGFDASHGIKILLYGKSGTGKTHLWGTFPKPILVAICSGGRQPGELRTLDTVENRKGGIKQVTLLRKDERDEEDNPGGGSDELTELADGAVGQGYKTIVLDHVTGFQDFVLGEILGRPVPEQKGWGVAEQQQWGQCAMQCKEKIKALLGLPINVVFIGQEREHERPQDSELIQPVVGVATTPSLAGWLNTAVDYIGNTFLRAAETTEMLTTGVGKMATQTPMRKPRLRADGSPAVEYCLRTAPHPTYMTKFRVPRGTEDIPSVLVDPTYEKIMGVIRGEAPVAR